MERIQNEIHLEKEKALADAEFYKKERDGKYSCFFFFFSLSDFLSFSNKSKFTELIFKMLPTRNFDCNCFGSQLTFISPSTLHSFSATANIALHTPAYIQLEATRALAQNHKIYWGEKLPSFLIEERSATHEEKVIAPLLKEKGRFG